MHIKYILGIFILSLNITCLHGQTIKFTYDENGNRIDRYIVVNSLSPGSIRFPIVNPEDFPVENQKEGPAEGELSIFVFPNPSKGLIKIDISNIPLNSKTEARLYDLSGGELIVKMNFENHCEIDISQLLDGIYIMRIKVNENLFAWKVVKSH